MKCVNFNETLNLLTPNLNHCSYISVKESLKHQFYLYFMDIYIYVCFISVAGWQHFSYSIFMTTSNIVKEHKKYYCKLDVVVIGQYIILFKKYIYKVGVKKAEPPLNVLSTPMKARLELACKLPDSYSFTVWNSGIHRRRRELLSQPCCPPCQAQ